MQRILDLLKKRKYLYISAFLLPFFIYGAIFVLLRVTPFGPRTILVTDMHTQYVQFYTYLYDVLKNGKSLFYSWEAGMGLNFFGVFAYYLASPLSFIIIFFDRAHLPEAMEVMTLLKVGLAGLTMAYFLSKVWNKRGISILFFSTLYALMSFVTVYSFCVMWLEGIYLLPLILYGVEKLLESNRYLLLIFSLALMFISNFYIAYMVGIFTFLFFISRYLLLYDYRNVKFAIKKFLLFCLSTGLAAGISAIVTLPMYENLKTNFADRGKIPLTTTFNFDLLPFYARFFNGVVDSTVNGLPNVYVGVITLLLVPLFFISKKIHIREKIIFGALLVIFLVSFEIPSLNLAWHAFQKPTNFPYRYSFLFSFCLLVMAFRTYSVFDETLLSPLKKIVLFNIFMIILLASLTQSYLTSNKVIINIFLVVVYLLLLTLKVKFNNKKAFVPLLLAVVVFFEVALNTVYSIKLLSFEYGYINKNAYEEPISGYSEMFNSIANKDKGFYRAETTTPTTWNDSLQFGYKGITHFNTVANGHLNLYMQDLGYGYLEALILQYGQGIVPMDDMLGIKYLVSKTPLNKYGFRQIQQLGNLRLYENQNALPAGFMMDKNQFDTIGKDKISTRQINYTNAFDAQNKFIGKLNNEQATSYYAPLTPQSVRYNNLVCIPKVSKNSKIPENIRGNIVTMAKQQPQMPASIHYTFHVQGDQQLYMQMRTQPQGVTGIFVNGKSLGKAFGVYPTYYWNNGILDLGRYKDQNVTVEVKVSRSTVDIQQNMFYGLNVHLIQQRVNQIKREALNVTNYTERSISGEINVKKNNMLFLSIPYDKGWKAQVDGKDLPLLKLNDAFTGMNLTQGHHRITLKYTPPGFNTGIAISIVSLVFTLVIWLFSRRAHKAM